MKNSVGILVGACTDVGIVRRLNEDAFGTPQTYQIDEQYRDQCGTLVAVADGMGGHAAGEVASRIAVETLFEVFYSGRECDPGRSLTAGFARANEMVRDHGSDDPTKRNMGTTLVAAAISGDQLYVANVGDSRAYLVRGAGIHQITDDHSWVAEQVRANIITQDQADAHIFKNIITRAIGSKADSHADLFQERLKPRDVLVLCSDGLSNKVQPHEIRAIAHGIHDPQESAEELVDLAKQRGGEDNITVVVVRVLHVPGRLHEWMTRFSR